MSPVRINVMGDDFLVFSLPYGNFDIDFLSGYEFDYAVVLMPSIKADFYIKTYSKRKNLIDDNYAAAISAAAFLILLRGLPLSEIRFETDFGFIDIFYTGDCLFSVLIDKCKELFTKSKNLLGCEIEYTDVFVGKRVRVVKTKNIDAFDTSALSGFLLADEKMPDSVTLTSTRGGVISIKRSDGFNPSPITMLLSFVAASYIEKVDYKEKIYFSDGASYCTKNHSSVTVTAKPIILNVD